MIRMIKKAAFIAVFATQLNANPNSKPLYSYDNKVVCVEDLHEQFKYQFIVFEEFEDEGEEFKDDYNQLKTDLLRDDIFYRHINDLSQQQGISYQDVIERFLIKPTEEQLKSYYEEHRNRLGSLSFEQAKAFLQFQFEYQQRDDLKDRVIKKLIMTKRVILK